MHTVCSTSETHEASRGKKKNEARWRIEKDTRETGHSREDFEPRGERALYKSWTTLLLFQCKDDVHSVANERGERENAIDASRPSRRSRRAHRSFERRSIHVALCPLSLDTENGGDSKKREGSRGGELIYRFAIRGRDISTMMQILTMR